MGNNLEDFALAWIFGTDIDKFKMLLDNIGIKYTIEDTVTGLIVINVDENSILQSYYNSISIYFNSDGKFDTFSAYGD